MKTPPQPVALSLPALQLDAKHLAKSRRRLVKSAALPKVEEATGETEVPPGEHTLSPLEAELELRSTSPASRGQVRKDEKRAARREGKVVVDALPWSGGDKVPNVGVAPPDSVVLYHTIVRDGAVPECFERDFGKLAEVIEPAANKVQKRLAQTDNMSAAVLLYPPKKYKSRLQLSMYQGPNARKEAEEGERRRWLQLLGNLLAGTPTPMGQLLTTRPGM